MRESQRQKYQTMKQFIFLKCKEQRIIQHLNEDPSIDFIDFVDAKNNTALHHAVELSYINVITQYLDLLGRVELWERKFNCDTTYSLIKYKTSLWVNAINNDGLTALHFAALKGNVKVAEALENAGARIDKLTKSGLNMFSLAAQVGKIQSLIYFQGKFNINASDNNQCTALHWAVFKGQQIVVRYLISQKEIQLDFKQKEGRTALHIAVLYNYPKIVKDLLMAGSNRIIRDNQNKTPKQYANQLSYEKISQMLVQQQRTKCFKKEFVFRPRKKQSGLANIFLLYSLIIATAILNYLRTYPSKKDQFFNDENNKNVEMSNLNLDNYFLGFSLLFSVVSSFLAVYIHCKKFKIQTKNLSYLQKNPQISEDYCFYCSIIAHQGVEHCFECHRCVEVKMKHSSLLGVCIGKRNIKKYILMLLTMDLGLLLHLITGGIILNTVLQNKQMQNTTLALYIVLATIDLICLLPLAVASYFALQSIKVACNMNQYLVIKKLSESTFDSRSTLIAEKLKGINLSSN